MTNELLETAIEYSRIGLSVIPVGRDKKPLVAWKEFQNRIASEDEINQWWAQWPQANVGIVTGAVSDLIVLDCDNEAAFEEWRAKLQSAGIETATCKTGRGAHFYFQHPGDKVKNFAAKQPGLDLRGDGGYVIAPPSIHASGVLYQWI